MNKAFTRHRQRNSNVQEFRLLPRLPSGAPFGAYQFMGYASELTDRHAGEVITVITCEELQSTGEIQQLNTREQLADSAKVDEVGNRTLGRWMAQSSEFPLPNIRLAKSGDFGELLRMAMAALDGPKRNFLIDAIELAYCAALSAQSPATHSK